MSGPLGMLRCLSERRAGAPGVKLRRLLSHLIQQEPALPAV